MSPPHGRHCPFILTFFSFPSKPAIPRRSRNRTTMSGKFIKKKKSHVAMSCHQRTLECVALACLPRLRLRAHQSSPLAAEYAPLEALEPFAPHSDPRTDIAQSHHHWALPLASSSAGPRKTCRGILRRQAPHIDRSGRSLNRSLPCAEPRSASSTL